MILKIYESAPLGLVEWNRRCRLLNVLESVVEKSTENTRIKSMSLVKGLALTFLFLSGIEGSSRGPRA
jgi:hypothetical protein